MVIVNRNISGVHDNTKQRIKDLPWWIFSYLEEKDIQYCCDTDNKQMDGGEVYKDTRVLI